MTKPPPPDLPDTDDPWAVLDVPRGSPAAEIRRAYLRRIKVYKPDAHPEAFTRIRAAFEALYDDERDRPTAAVGGWDDEDDARPPDSIEQGWGHTVPPGTDAGGLSATRAAAKKDERARTETLVLALERAISADDRDEAVRLLLEPEHAMLAVDPRVADAVVRVACSVALSQPERFEELWSAFADVLHEQAIEYRHGIMASMRSAAREWPAWQRAIGDAHELSRFVELSGTLDDGRLHALGREVAERAQSDPQEVGRRLQRAERDAPAVLDLYVQAVDAWTERFGAPSRRESDGEASIAPALASLLARNEILSGAKLRRTIGSGLVVLLVLWLSTSPILMGAAALALLSIVNALAFDPTTRIYREILRPAIAAWVWQGHDIDDAVVALKTEVDRLPTGRRVFEPDTPSRYPELLAADRALAAWASTARMRAP
jgi:hypothetical protein